MTRVRPKLAVPWHACWPVFLHGWASEKAALVNAALAGDGGDSEGNRRLMPSRPKVLLMARSGRGDAHKQGVDRSAETGGERGTSSGGHRSGPFQARFGHRRG